PSLVDVAGIVESCSLSLHDALPILVMDGLDAASVGEAVAAAAPDVVVHQMTAIAPEHAGKPDIKHMDRWFAPTLRLRTEGTDHLDRKSTRLNSSHVKISYAVFCLKK